MQTDAATIEDGLDIPLKLGTEPPYGPAIPLLGVNPEGTRVEKDACTPVFTAALLTIARTWRRPDAHRQMDGQGSCGAREPRSITQPQKGVHLSLS